MLLQKSASGKGFLLFFKIFPSRTSLFAITRSQLGYRTPWGCLPTWLLLFHISNSSEFLRKIILWAFFAQNCTLLSEKWQKSEFKKSCVRNSSEFDMWNCSIYVYKHLITTLNPSWLRVNAKKCNRWRFLLVFEGFSFLNVIFRNNAKSAQLQSPMGMFIYLNTSI